RPRRPRGARRRRRPPAGLQPDRGRAHRRSRAPVPARGHGRHRPAGRPVNPTAATLQAPPEPRAATALAVEGRDLRKSYGSHVALQGVSFEIRAGEVFGLLGPNGAGKTTTVEILEGYRKRDSGDVSVLGVDPGRAGREWRERIGVVLQSSAMYP